MSLQNKPKKLSDLLSKYKQEDENKRISREFQQYAYDLAVELNDLSHKSLYMRLAKTMPREQLEAARRFVKDAQNAKSKGRLFMWKVGELKKKSKEKEKLALSSEND